MKPFVKLFRRVLPKSTQSVNEKTDKENRLLMEDTSNMTSISEIDQVLVPSSSSSATDIKALEYQIENLKGLVENLKGDIENKEINIAKLAREKEKLSLDLLKQKRSNNNIVKQLEEERKFYFQEKEIYCQEMNEIKEMKKKFSKSNTTVNEKSSKELKNEIDNLKNQLKQTLETNYNLSIKFLRIKNTKSFLRNELIKTKIDHERIFLDLKAKIEMMATEVEDLVNSKSHLYVSPSNRNYVQLVRQNSSLVHENLCLQMAIDRLNSQFDKMKLKYTKSETNSRLKYIHCTKSEGYSQCKHLKKDKKKVRITTVNKILADEKPQPKLKSSLKASKHESDVIKIFERNKSSDTPAILMINEEENKNYHKTPEEVVNDHHKSHKNNEKHQHLSKRLEERVINEHHRCNDNEIGKHNRTVEEATSIGKSNGDEIKQSRHKKHKKSRKKHESSLNPDESRQDLQHEIDSKKDSSHKSCIIKLAPIAEMDEVDITANKN